MFNVPAQLGISGGIYPEREEPRIDGAQTRPVSRSGHTDERRQFRDFGCRGRRIAAVAPRLDQQRPREREGDGQPCHGGAHHLRR